MNYRILEHPEGNFIPQLSVDGGISWESLICYKHMSKWSVHRNSTLCWGEDKKKLALETITNHKKFVAENAVNRIVYQE